MFGVRFRLRTGRMRLEFGGGFGDLGLGKRMWIGGCWRGCGLHSGKRLR